MRITRIDHFVLTVASVETTCDFYARVLGMGVVTFGEGRRALTFGAQKINLHQVGHAPALVADAPAPGSADFCLITDRPLDEVVAHLHELGISIEEGPVERTGATGPIRSVYFRDPDRNLVEVAECL